MKKFLSVFLSLVLVIMVIVPASFASDKQGTNEVVANSVEEALRMSGKQYPIVFVTGIGQTFSYYLDDNSNKTMYLHGEAHNFSTMANLFLLDTEITTIISDIFSDIGSGSATSDDVIRALKQVQNNRIVQNSFGSAEQRANFVKVIGQIISTLATGNYSVNYDDLCMFAKGLLRDNIIDENGKLPEYILSSTYECPVSEFDVNPDGTENGAFGKGRFYRDIPCREILADIGEENVFCYNYAAFGNLSTISAGLDHLINDVILGEDGYFPDAEKVVLIPMSMGAAMVSQYLYNCEQANKDPHVARVVSIVGCWNGSSIMADLIERKYDEKSAELFYTKWPVFTGGNATTGAVLNNIWRLFHHDSLSKLVTDLLGAICDELVLKSPSMLALIPCDRYDAIRNEYLTRPGYEKVLEQLDTYHQVQLHLQERMEKLNSQYGVEFFFVSGYALNLGAGYEVYNTSRDNYSFFGFLYSANKVNSDEIIPIESTAPGTTSVKVGDKFSDEYIAAAQAKGTDKYIDPYSQSIDLSTAYYPDHTWAFYQQVHQLDNNNTALRLAFKIASGEINSVNDCPDVFPQFNDSRDLRNLKGHLEWAKLFIAQYESDAECAELVAQAKDYVAQAEAIIESTINHRDDEEAFTKEFGKFRSDAEMILRGEDPNAQKEPTFWDTYGEKIVKTIDSTLFKVFGTNGFPDVADNFKKIVMTVLKAVISYIPSFQ